MGLTNFERLLTISRTLTIEFSTLTGFPVPILIVITTCLLHVCIGRAVESPHWLVLKGQMRQAYLSLCRLRKSEVQAARDLYRIHTQTAPERQCYKRTGFAGKVYQLVKLPPLKRALLPSAIIGVSTMLTDAQIISPEEVKSIILSKMTLAPPSLFMAGTIVVLIVVFGLRVFSTYAIELYGRRGLLMRTMPHMLWPLLLVGFTGALQNDWTRMMSKIALLMIFMLISAISDFVPFTYFVESFPVSHRGRYYPFLSL